MSTLVTGAGGFVGRALVQALREADVDGQTVAVDLTLPAGDSDRVSWHAADLSDGAAIREILSAHRPTVVFHAAGLARGSDWDALYRVNVATTITLLEAVGDVCPGCVVVIPGSAAEYGPVPLERLPVVETEQLRPTSPYGVSKAWQTLAALSFVARGLDVRVARLFNIVGPTLPESFALGRFAAQLRQIAAGDGPAIVRTGPLDTSRDFLDVRDVASGFIAVANRGQAGEVYNVCSGASVAMRACLEMLIEATGLDVDVLSESAVDHGAIQDSFGSREKIGVVAGWTPTITLEQSIADLWARP